MKFRRGLMRLLLDHRLWSSERADEGVVVLRVAAFVLIDFPLDLFRCVLVIILLISGHRLQGGNRKGQMLFVQRQKKMLYESVLKTEPDMYG